MNFGVLKYKEVISLKKSGQKELGPDQFLRQLCPRPHERLKYHVWGPLHHSCFGLVKPFLDDFSYCEALKILRLL